MAACFCTGACKGDPGNCSVLKRNQYNKTSSYMENLYNIVDDQKNTESKRCRHDACPECHGTGRKSNGQNCVHMISCPCPKHTPTYM